MDTIVPPQLTYGGRFVDMTPDCFGPLRRSDDVMGDRAELWRRFSADGYLYLPGLLDRREVIAARRTVLQRLDSAGALDPAYPITEAVAISGEHSNFSHQLARENRELERVLYGGAMMEFYEMFLGGTVCHYDYTWFRAKSPGTNTATTPHYDVVYMGRGTLNLYTSWTPLSDIPYAMGGLLVLEGSHRLQHLIETYGQTDVDRFCANHGEAEEIVMQARSEGRELSAGERDGIRWDSTGAYADDAVVARAELGGRWLGAEYQMGDLLIFSMHTMHASSDNQTDRIRLSSDSRYQLASEPIDDRWIGENPAAHGIRAKRGMIC